MTRKDYTAVAEAIRPQARLLKALDGSETAILALLGVVDNLCDTFAADNPRFDRVRFIEACGVSLSKAAA